MSVKRAGYHWELPDEPRGAPCFKCGLAPRLEHHSVCEGCHRTDGLCHRCHPELAYVAPPMQKRGILTRESEEGFAHGL